MTCGSQVFVHRATSWPDSVNSVQARPARVTIASVMGALVRDFPNSTRRISASCGIVALLALSIGGGGEFSSRIANLALVAICLAAAMAWWELLGGGRRESRPTAQGRNRRSRPWGLATLGVALVAGLAVQSWFTPGTVIAGGDAGPPVGTAWLSRLFEPWVWGGSSLGQPSELALALPWAAVLASVQAVGGDPELAQRLWYTALFIGAGLAAFGLMAALRLGLGASLVGTAVYLFNPYVVNAVGSNPVAIAALLLLVAMPATVLAAGAGRLSVASSAALMALAAPIFGYVDFNPPLVGMVLGAMVITPLLAGWVDGRQAGIRSLRALLLAIPLLVVSSLYWIIPASLFASGVPAAQLANALSWTWTEGRATIANAFWLNTNWGWDFPEYYPYASAYDQIPLSLLKFTLPAIAFSALALNDFGKSANKFLNPDRALRLATAGATIAAVVIFLSSGTNPPGNVVFNPLYALPFGWLLREPGRFLMVVALAYAVLIAVVVDALPSLWRTSVLTRSGSRWWQMSRALVAPIALATALCLGFPLFTGAVVPDSRPLLPSSHVRVPGYWAEMAQFVDSLPTKGTLLVMPPDDFYQMPYTWGYYGTDGFIADLFKRPVLVPNGQGYLPASNQLLDSVNLIARSIVARDWRETEALAKVLDTPLLLVRRDIQSSFPGRSIADANDLATALTESPEFVLIRTYGPLELFAVTVAMPESEHVSSFATTASPAPDLRLLSLLPDETVLITSRPQSGVENVVQAPPLQLWQYSQDGVDWRAATPPGSSYSIAELGSRTVVSLDHSGTYQLGRSGTRITYAANSAVTVSVPGQPAIANGDFASGLWGPVGDCNNALGSRAQPYLHAIVVPSGVPGSFPVLRLSASVDSACESQRMVWNGGSLLLSVMVHQVSGTPPRLCLWEVGPQKCASLPSLPEAKGWSVYQASVTPDAGATALDLVLYADEPPAGAGTTITEYAHVRATEVPDLLGVDLLASPVSSNALPARLIVSHTSYSTHWQGPAGAEHVIADGLLNAWLTPPGSTSLVAVYVPSSLVTLAQWLSLVMWLITLVVTAGRTARSARGKY